MSAGRILFVEDQYDTLKSYLKVLKTCNLITDDELKEINRFKGDTQKEQFEKFNSVLNGRIEVATCFADAFEKIQEAKTGDEYDCFFIDRNLAGYSDIDMLFTKNHQIKAQKEFSKDFFNGFKSSPEDTKIFIGDYFVVVLINAGVPIEKIYFLTANNNGIQELLKSPYLHANRLPRYIDKTNDSFEEDLIEILNNSHCAKVRFLYKDIFENAKVKDIWGAYIEKFIAILAKRYKSGAKSNYKGDGIILRNMIEAIVAYIADDNNFKSRLQDPKEKDTVRRFLNCDLLGYSREFEKKLSFIHKDWVRIKGILGKNVFSNNDAPSISKCIKTNANTNLIIKYSCAKTLTALNDFYFCNPYDFPPKYIFAYIDNIYTVTSEFSAHGKNDKTTKGLSTDGWSALLSGMLQIMQWVAATNPNPTSPQS